MNVIPAMVMVPVRATVVVLAAIEYATALLPIPVAPDVIAIQFAWLETAHVAEVDEDVTATVALAAAAGKLAEVGDKENVGPAAACVTPSERPAIVIEPERDAVALFAATE